MQLPIFVEKVSHLTDARYFAAMNVQFLSFDISIIDFEAVKAIAAWVEGPLNIIDISAMTLDFLANENIEDDFVDGYLIDKQQSSFKTEKLKFIKNEDQIELISTGQKFAYPPKDLTNIDFASAGLILSGSEEDTLGEGSFHEVATIFEFIEDLE